MQDRGLPLRVRNEDAHSLFLLPVLSVSWFCLCLRWWCAFAFPMYLRCVALDLACNPTLSFLYCVLHCRIGQFGFKGSLSVCTRDRGLTFNSARVLDASTRRSATDTRGPLSAVRALMPALAAFPQHVCHRLETGAVSRLAHAAGRGHFLGASTSGRTVSIT